MKTRKFLLAATAAMTALLFGLTSCEDKGGNGGLTLSPNYVTVAPGETETVTLNSDGVAVDAASVTWTSNNTDIFTIENGVITGVAVGHGTFTATYNNQSVTGDVEVSEVAPTVPSITPVEGGITIAIYIPEGSDCNGLPLWGGDTSVPTEWKGMSMTAVEGAENWFKVDFPSVSSAQGKPLARPEDYTDGDELGNWPTQIGEYEILQGSDICTRSGDNFVIEGTGLVAMWVKTWQENPCATYSDYTFYIKVPECTPDGVTKVNVTGSFKDSEGNTWSTGDYFDIVDGVATVTINGQDGMEWKVRLSDNWDAKDQAVECSTDDQGVTSIQAWPNKKLGESKGETFTVAGWGDTNVALEGCLTDCAVTSVTPAEPAE